jgi:hypothetical protein
MSRVRRAPRKRRGLWGFLSRLFGKPRGRHVLGTPPPPPPGRVEPRPTESAFEVGEAPVPAAAPLVTEVAVPVAIPHKRASASDPSLEPTAVRLIFVDGSVLPLPEGSVEERQAYDLARRVLDATRRHTG